MQCFKSPGSHFSQRGMGLGQCRVGAKTVASASLHLCYQKQQSKHRSLIFCGQSPFVQSGSHKLCASCSKNKFTTACFGAEARNGQLLVCSELKSIKIKAQFTVQAFSWELETSKRFQISKTVTSDRFCQCNCCLGGKIDFWCALFCYLPRILWSVDFLSKVPSKLNRKWTIFT